jgi:hypothetical protein
VVVLAILEVLRVFWPFGSFGDIFVILEILRVFDHFRGFKGIFVICFRF